MRKVWSVPATRSRTSDRDRPACSGPNATFLVSPPGSKNGDGTAAFYLNPASFKQPDTGTLSTLLPNTIVNPARFQNDLAISRTFPITSGEALQFRWEIFNVVNWVNLNAPVTALNNANFGKILSAGDPRIMQVALKFTF